MPDLEHRKMRFPLIRSIRPVVVVSEGSVPTTWTLTSSETGGDWEDGWFSYFYHPNTDEFPEIESSLGSKAWRVGRNIMLSSVTFSNRSISGSFGYDTGTVNMSSTSSGSITSTMSALGLTRESSEPYMYRHGL